MPEISGLIKTLEEHPMFNFLINLLQAKTDEAVASIFSGFNGPAMTDILSREQVIGAASSYLEPEKILIRLKAEIAEYNQYLAKHEP